MTSLGEGEQHFFRNVCRALKKAVRESKNSEEILEQTERFINAGHEVAWPHEHGAVHHKDRAEKAVQKVVSEVKRYVDSLDRDNGQAASQDVLDALSVVEDMASEIKAR